MLQIKIAQLQPGLHTFSFDPPAEDLDLDPEYFKEIHVEVRLDIGDKRILAGIEASGTAVLECDRTLVLFDQAISGNYTVLYAAPEVIEQEEGEKDEESILPLLPTDQEIDLTTPVRDTLLLAIPTRRIAPGAEDIEIPTTFGGDPEGIDPRWEALKQLRDSNAGE